MLDIALVSVESLTLFKFHLLRGNSKLNFSQTVLTVTSISQRQSLDILVA